MAVVRGSGLHLGCALCNQIVHQDQSIEVRIRRPFYRARGCRFAGALAAHLKTNPISYLALDRP